MDWIMEFIYSLTIEDRISIVLFIVCVILLVLSIPYVESVRGGLG